MTSEAIITSIFIVVDDKLPELKQHSQAKLHPSELVTIGILMALKGTSFRAFCWLKRDYRGLLPALPEALAFAKIAQNTLYMGSLSLVRAKFFQHYR